MRLQRRTLLALPLAVTAKEVTAQSTDAESFAEAERAILAGRTPIAGGISIDMPPLSENGNAVDVAIKVDSPMTAEDHARLVSDILAGESVRETVAAHARVAIRGTREARVETSDLVVLGGLNEGVWPSLPPPDPWLNRPMRMAAGLLPPERRIGLAAHDFTLAAAAPESCQVACGV